MYSNMNKPEFPKDRDTNEPKWSWTVFIAGICTGLLIMSALLIAS